MTQYTILHHGRHGDARVVRTKYGKLFYVQELMNRRWYTCVQFGFRKLASATKQADRTSGRRFDELY